MFCDQVLKWYKNKIKICFSSIEFNPFQTICCNCLNKGFYQVFNIQQCASRLVRSPRWCWKLLEGTKYRRKELSSFQVENISIYLSLISFYLINYWFKRFRMERLEHLVDFHRTNIYMFIIWRCKHLVGYYRTNIYMFIMLGGEHLVD